MTTLAAAARSCARQERPHSRGPEGSCPPRRNAKRCSGTLSRGRHQDQPRVVDPARRGTPSTRHGAEARHRPRNRERRAAAGDRRAGNRKARSSRPRRRGKRPAATTRRHFAEYPARTRRDASDLQAGILQAGSSAAHIARSLLNFPPIYAAVCHIVRSSQPYSLPRRPDRSRNHEVMNGRSGAPECHRRAFRGNTARFSDPDRLGNRGRRHRRNDLAVHRQPEPGSRYPGSRHHRGRYRSRSRWDSG